MNEKLCKRPGALTALPPVTSCQLINQMRLLLCLHSARPYWLVLVDLTITPRHMKMASDPSLIFNLGLHHFSFGISGTTVFISYCARLCLIIIYTGYIRGAVTLELSRIIVFPMCLLHVAFVINYQLVGFNFPINLCSYRIDRLNVHNNLFNHTF